jgi:hypothetical protein
MCCVVVVECVRLDVCVLVYKSVYVCKCVKYVPGCVRAGVYVYLRVYMVGIADSAHLRRLRTCAHAYTYAQSTCWQGHANANAI